MRDPDFFSSWWKWTSWSRTAVYAFTGTLTRPKLIVPVQTGRAMAAGVPHRRPAHAWARSSAFAARSTASAALSRSRCAAPSSFSARRSACSATDTSASACCNAAVAASCFSVAAAMAASRRCSPASSLLRRLRRLRVAAPGRDAGSRSAKTSSGAASPEPRIAARSCAAAVSLAATSDSRALARRAPAAGRPARAPRWPGRPARRCGRATTSSPP